MSVCACPTWAGRPGEWEWSLGAGRKRLPLRPRLSGSLPSDDIWEASCLVSINGQHPCLLVERKKALAMDIFGDLRRMNKRQLYYQVLNFAMIVSSALMIWKGLIVITGSESPIVVVLSGSMEPAFHRGDLLFLTNFRDDPIRAGEIVVFKVEGRDIPIVHRVIKVHEKENGNIKFLTKGDNNEVDDRGLYKEGQNWLEKKDVVGRARGFLPYVGMVTIIMNDYPKFKYALLAVMGAYVLLKRES
ncbi:signal peptidase complex catalytic subunit SEC11C [Sceloporus undulatus]|nr:signal peptidase complex catalytic subunit SEC11C [Sceloporus undulatus]